VRTAHSRKSGFLSAFDQIVSGKFGRPPPLRIALRSSEKTGVVMNFGNAQNTQG